MPKGTTADPQTDLTTDPFIGAIPMIILLSRSMSKIQGIKSALPVFLLLLFVGSGTHAFGTEIRGSVLDSETGILLQGVRISVDESDQVTFSERGGAYALRNLKPGDYTLKASFVGYPEFSQHVTLEDSDSISVVTVDFSAEQLLELEEYRVEGSLVGQAKAINLQRSADNIKNVISSDAIGQFVDRNAAEALQRLPGISIEESQGEGKFVIIRGADPSINSIAIDGVAATTPEEDGRTTALNIISIDQLESIEVTKSWLPDKSANFIGGSVDLITRSALDRGSRFASVVYAQGSHKVSDDRSYRVNATYGDVLGKNKRIGIQFSFDFSNDNRGSDTLKTIGWHTLGTPEVQGAPQGLMLEGLQLEDFVIKRKRTGISGKIEYRLNENHRFYFSLSRNQFDDDEVLQETQLRQDVSSSSDYAARKVFDKEIAIEIGLDPTDPEVAARLALPPEGRKIHFDEAILLGDLAFDPELRMYTVQTWAGRGAKSWKSTLTNDEILTYQGGGKHRLFNLFDLDYKIYRSDANKDWTEQRLRFDSPVSSSVSGIVDGVPFLVESGEIYSDPAKFQISENRGHIQDNAFTSADERFGFDANLELQYRFLGLDWKTKFGAAGDLRDKKFDRDFQNFSDVRTPETVDRLTLADADFDGGLLVNFMEDFGDYEFGPVFATEKARRFIDNPGEVEFVETRDDTTLNVTDALLKNYDAGEDISAFYLMQTLNWKRFRFIAGARYEKTENTFTNNEIDPRSENLPETIRFANPGFWQLLIERIGTEAILTEVTSARQYEHLLPAFHVIFSLSERNIIRASYTQTFARPKFTDLVPREIIDVDGARFGTKVELPNFDLAPTESENFDVSFERYAGKLGLLSFNFFYKKLNGPVYEETRVISAGREIAPMLAAKYDSQGIDAAEWKTSRMANAGAGEITGVEVAWNRKLDFLPSPFDGFGFNFNATHVDSKVQLLLEERFDEEVPLFKQSDYLEAVPNPRGFGWKPDTDINLRHVM